LGFLSIVILSLVIGMLVHNKSNKAQNDSIFIKLLNSFAHGYTILLILSIIIGIIFFIIMTIFS